MTTMPRILNTALLAVALTAPAATLGAQAAPPAPKPDSAPALLPPPRTPPPPAAGPMVRTRAQAAPLAGETAVRATVAPLPQVSAPVESVRPAAATAPRVPSGRDAPAVPPAPPAPVARQAAQQNAPEPAAVPDGPPPVGATARCKDGTYLFAPASEQSCSAHTGLVVLFPPRPAPPTPPRRP